ncbi:hypothetical protein, conserved, partial [Eimeria acervulina]
MLNAITFVVAAFVSKALVVDAESPTVQAGMVVGQLRVAPASGRNALIGIGNDPDQFQMGIDGSGEFVIASPRTTILSVDNEDTMRIYADLSTRYELPSQDSIRRTFFVQNFSRSRTNAFSSLDLKGPLFVRGVAQFRTTHREDFSGGKAEGWDNP